MGGVVRNIEVVCNWFRLVFVISFYISKTIAEGVSQFLRSFA